LILLCAIVFTSIFIMVCTVALAGRRITEHRKNLSALRTRGGREGRARGASEISTTGSAKPGDLSTHSATANLVAWYRMGDLTDTISTEIRDRIDVLKQADSVREILGKEISERFDAELWDKKAIVHLVEIIKNQGFSDGDIEEILKRPPGEVT